jgi:hypothetical protein
MYTVQENTFIIEVYFLSHPFAINHIWNFDVYFEIEVGIPGGASYTRTREIATSNYIKLSKFFRLTWLLVRYIS